MCFPISDVLRSASGVGDAGMHIDPREPKNIVFLSAVELTQLAVHSLCENDTALKNM